MNDYEFIDGTRLSSVIEALIFASPEPITPKKLCELIAQGDEQLELETDAIEPFVDKLNQRYEENGLAFNIEHVAGGYTFSTKKRYEAWLSIFQHEDAYRKLSQSAIESLAIVAYKQPITKPEVDEIRGVDSGYILRQLLEKVLIEVSGRLDAPGKPLLYRTTKHFLKHFGINSIDELPKPREIEEILKDDDMADHRQFLIDRQLELTEMREDTEEEISENKVSLLEAVEKIKGKDEENYESDEESDSEPDREVNSEDEGEGEIESEAEVDMQEADLQNKRNGSETSEREDKE